MAGNIFPVEKKHSVIIMKGSLMPDEKNIPAQPVGLILLVDALERRFRRRYLRHEHSRSDESINQKENRPYVCQ